MKEEVVWYQLTTNTTNILEIDSFHSDQFTMIHNKTPLTLWLLAVAFLRVQSVKAKIT